jgi:outer membrane protein TolC
VLAALILAVATAPTPAPAPVLPKIPAVAPGYAAPAVPIAAPHVIGVTQQEFVGITLDNAVGMALSNDPDLAVVQANRRIAHYQIEAAQGAFDIRLSLQPQYQYVTEAPQNAFFAGPNFGPIVQRNASVSAGAQGVTPAGQQYGVSVAGRQTYDNTTINAFNPTYPTVFSVNFSQPLGKNSGITDASRNLMLAQINDRSAAGHALSVTENTIAQVEDVYWDLVAAWRNAAIQEDALRSTVTQQHSNIRLANQGVAAPIDVVQSNTQIAVFQENVFSALQRVGALQNQLKSLLSNNPNDPVWNANLVPTAPVLQLPQEPPLADLVVTALRNRPEVGEFREQRAAADVNLRFAQNQTKPQVDLQLGYTSNGFAGTPTSPGNSPFLASSAQQLLAINALIAAVNPTLPPSQQIQPLPSSNTPVPAYLSGGLSQSIRNLLNNRFPVYAAGVLVTFPVGNHTAKANLAIAQEQENIAQVQEASTIQRITVEVRNALQAYQSALARLSAASAARQAAEAVLASEQRRFRAGASTTFLVLQREIAVANDRGLELQAQTDLNKAVVEIQRATGTILTR